jgi:hypothetical protein
MFRLLIGHHWDGMVDRAVVRLKTWRRAVALVQKEGHCDANPPPGLGLSLWLCEAWKRQITNK